MRDLLPCPFCGGEAEVERRGTPRVSSIVACTDCGARVEANLVGDDSLHWNTRAAPPLPEGEHATWCPQYGPRVAVDEDGCCASCGADATGEGADRAIAAVAELERIRRELSRLSERLEDTFMGGYSDPRDLGIFRHGMGTAATCIEAVLRGDRNQAPIVRPLPEGEPAAAPAPGVVLSADEREAIEWARRIIPNGTGRSDLAKRLTATAIAVLDRLLSQPSPRPATLTVGAALMLPEVRSGEKWFASTTKDGTACFLVDAGVIRCRIRLTHDFNNRWHDTKLSLADLDAECTLIPSERTTP
jgi:Lar family restriction alleviation protein